MKTNPIIRQISSLIVLASIIFSTTESFSQQVINFKDGTTITGYITYQKNDTVKYYLEDHPQIVYIETMDHIERITPLEHKPVFTSDSLERLFNKKQYKHYKHMTIQGSILLPIGALLTGIGISGWVSSSDDHSDAANLAKVPITIFTVVGCAGVLSGFILLTTGITNMQSYKKKMNGFSFDLKYTPQQTGISVVYRF